MCSWPAALFHYSSALRSLTPAGSQQVDVVYERAQILVAAFRFKDALYEINELANDVLYMHA